jgi:serine/threonine-protein kinase RsbW
LTRVITTITGPGDELARVPELLDELARGHQVDAEAVADMQIALDEILSNILRYGFADGQPHRVDVTLSVDRERLTAEVEDNCAPFDPLTVAPPDLEAPLQDRRVGGLGVHFVRRLMSEVRYARLGGRNRLVLSKSLTRGDGADGTA